MLWLYTGFVVLVVVVLCIDLFFVNRKAHEVSISAALKMTALCVALALGCAVFVYFGYDRHWFGLGLPETPEGEAYGARRASAEFLTGWMLEYALSIDNIFVISVIFSYFKIPARYQHRVLFWGILGALVMRGIMIGVGVQVVNRFEWLLYVLGAFLLLTGVKMLLAGGDDDFDPGQSRVLRLARRVMPMTERYDGQKFFTRENGVLVATPLVPALIVVETTDVVFAVDSIPVIVGITRENFLVFSSNMLAILGLRSLFFVLAGMLDRFRYLKVSLSLVLVVIGVKMLVHDWYHPPVWMSLGVVVLLLGGGVLASLLSPAPAPMKGAEGRVADASSRVADAPSEAAHAATPVETKAAESAT